MSGLDHFGGRAGSVCRAEASGLVAAWDRLLREELATVCGVARTLVNARGCCMARGKWTGLPRGEFHLSILWSHTEPVSCLSSISHRPTLYIYCCALSALVCICMWVGSARAQLLASMPCCILGALVCCSMATGFTFVWRSSVYLRSCFGRGASAVCLGCSFRSVAQPWLLLAF